MSDTKGKNSVPRASTDGESTTEDQIEERDMYLVCYTYTPAVQKRATTPKPPSMLAVEATATSFSGIVLLGRLQLVLASIDCAR